MVLRIGDIIELRKCVPQGTDLQTSTRSASLLIKDRGIITRYAGDLSSELGNQATQETSSNYKKVVFMMLITKKHHGMTLESALSIKKNSTNAFSARTINFAPAKINLTTVISTLKRDCEFKKNKSRRNEFTCHIETIRKNEFREIENEK